MKLEFKVDYFEVNEKDRYPMISISTEDYKDDNAFEYSNIYQAKSTQVHGIQVNNTKLEKPLMKMCDKIAQAVYDFQKEIKNEI